MSDQLLRAHEVMEYVYNVADVAYPVSIRDQMNRARWLVRKAFDLGFFGPSREAQYRKLLVCGAGAAGVTAARHALSLGVETHLVEQSSAPFLRQRRCTSRWIDPTQYDWSADFWTHGAFPYPGTPSMALPWLAGLSNRVALSWLPLFNAAKANPLLTYRRRDHVVGAPAPARNRAGGHRRRAGDLQERQHHRVWDGAPLRWLRGRAPNRATKFPGIRFLGNGSFRATQLGSGAAGGRFAWAGIRRR